MSRFVPRPLTVVAVLVYAFLFLPIVVLVLFSFNSSRSMSDFGGLSTAWYAALWHNEDVRSALGKTLAIAATSTAVATVLGTLAAFALTRYRFRLRPSYSGFLFVPLVVPEVVLGISLLALFVNVLHVPLGFWTVVIAHVTFSISLVVVVVKARLRTLDRRLEEASADLGMGPLATFRYVTLPLATPGIAGAAALAFLLSFDDVIITGFVSGPGTTTLPLYVWGQVRRGVSPEINALSALMALTTVLLLVVPLGLRWAVGRLRARGA